MLTFVLDPTDDRAKPVFKDVASCKRWLAELQLTNMQLVHSLLLTEINEFVRYPMRGLDRMDTLEALRETVGYVQHEYAKRLAAKPLPLNEHDLIVFASIVQLWLAMANGYQRCLQTLVAGDKHLDPHRAMLCQRAMHYGGRAIDAHLHVGYEVDGKLWRLMHGLYRFAESQDLLAEDVTDPFAEPHHHLTCQQTYLSTLLTEYARPAALSRAQLHLLASWMPQWLALLGFEQRYSASRGDAPPLGVDLDGPPHGLQLAGAIKPDTGVRYLSMVPLSKSIRVRTILLQQGKTPEQVDLGTVANSHDCIELLGYLHRQWCEPRSVGPGASASGDKTVQLCYQPENIYAHLTGKPSAESATETWRIDQGDALGAELTRVSSSGGQLGRRQLIALRRSEQSPYLLAATAWVQVARTGQLRVGVHLLPGKVEAVILHASEADKTIASGAGHAFLLHAIAESKLPPSLIMPKTWFQAGRILELLRADGTKQAVRLAFSVEQGIDFERVGFMPA